MLLSLKLGHLLSKIVHLLLLFFSLAQDVLTGQQVVARDEFRHLLDALLNIESAVEQGTDLRIELGHDIAGLSLVWCERKRLRHGQTGRRTTVLVQ